MVGAGGIGCELLKTLVLTGFENIMLVRMASGASLQVRAVQLTTTNSFFCTVLHHQFLEMTLTAAIGCRMPVEHQVRNTLHIAAASRCICSCCVGQPPWAWADGHEGLTSG